MSLWFSDLATLLFFDSCHHHNYSQVTNSFNILQLILVLRVRGYNMPKSLVVPLDDQLYENFAKLCKDDGLCLKDRAYELIKAFCENHKRRSEGRKPR